MTVKRLQAPEFDITMNLFHYYRDEAIESIPEIEEQYDENSAIETVREYATQASHCWLNLYDGQRPVGFVAGYLVATPWNKNRLIAHIQFIYIIETHRNLDNFRQLLEAFESWSKNNFDVKQISAGDIGINPDKMKKLYEHFDFKQVLTMTKEV